MDILILKDVKKVYGTKNSTNCALNGINLSVKKGEFVGIMGPSGSGKTTLLNCISTIDFPTEGNIIINEKNIAKMKESELEEFRRNELSFIFQDFNLLDTLTARENISLALSIQGRNYIKIKELVNDTAKKLGIEHILDKYPYEMSGGQKQRVASARAIVTDPSMILADEPTGSLDSKSSEVLLTSFQKLNKELKTTILMVTHDSFSASYTNRIFFIKDGVIYKEIIKGKKSRKEFFNDIMEVLIMLGGNTDVF